MGCVAVRAVAEIPRAASSDAVHTRLSANEHICFLCVWCVFSLWTTVIEMLILHIFCIGILYANLESFSIEFQEIRGWGPVVGSLPFIALLVGVFLATAANIYNNTYYSKRFKVNKNQSVPETRLPPMMLGGFAFTAGLFIFGCKDPRSYPSSTIELTGCRDILSKHQLLAIHYRNCLDWVWLHGNLPGSLELPRRYLYPVQCQCRGRQYLSSINGGRGVPALRYSYVSWDRCGLGDYCLRLYCSRIDPSPFPLLLLGQTDSCEGQVE